MINPLITIRHACGHLRTYDRRYELPGLPLTDNGYEPTAQEIGAAIPQAEALDCGFTRCGDPATRRRDY
jgi:hypothetical protein